MEVASRGSGTLPKGAFGNPIPSKNVTNRRSKIDSSLAKLTYHLRNIE